MDARKCRTGSLQIPRGECACNVVNCRGALVPPGQNMPTILVCGRKLSGRAAGISVRACGTFAGTAGGGLRQSEHGGTSRKPAPTVHFEIGSGIGPGNGVMVMGQQDARAASSPAVTITLRVYPDPAYRRVFAPRRLGDSLCSGITASLPRAPRGHARSPGTGPMWAGCTMTRIWNRSSRGIRSTARRVRCGPRVRRLPVVPKSRVRQTAVLR